MVKPVKPPTLKEVYISSDGLIAYFKCSRDYPAEKILIELIDLKKTVKYKHLLAVKIMMMKFQNKQITVVESLRAQATKITVASTTNLHYEKLPTEHLYRRKTAKQPETTLDEIWQQETPAYNIVDPFGDENFGKLINTTLKYGENATKTDIGSNKMALKKLETEAKWFREMESPLDVLKKGNNEICGITTAMVYFGTAFTASSFHSEDFNVPSAHYLFTGSGQKDWLIFHSENIHKLNAYIDDPQKCPMPCLHKTHILGASTLTGLSIPHHHIPQYAGELVVTFSEGSHMVCNSAVNVGIAKNWWDNSFALAARSVERCTCHIDTGWKWLHNLLYETEKACHMTRTMRSIPPTILAETRKMIEQLIKKYEEEKENAADELQTESETEEKNDELRKSRGSADSEDVEMDEHQSSISGGEEHIVEEPRTLYFNSVLALQPASSRIQPENDQIMDSETFDQDSFLPSGDLFRFDRLIADDNLLPPSMNSNEEIFDPDFTFYGDDDMLMQNENLMQSDSDNTFSGFDAAPETITSTGRQDPGPLTDLNQIFGDHTASDAARNSTEGQKQRNDDSGHLEGYEDKENSTISLSNLFEQERIPQILVSSERNLIDNVQEVQGDPIVNLMEETDPENDYVVPASALDKTRGSTGKSAKLKLKKPIRIVVPAQILSNHILKEQAAKLKRRESRRVGRKRKAVVSDENDGSPKLKIARKKSNSKSSKEALTTSALLLENETTEALSSNQSSNSNASIVPTQIQQNNHHESFHQTVDEGEIQSMPNYTLQLIETEILTAIPIQLQPDSAAAHFHDDDVQTKSGDIQHENSVVQSNIGATESIINHVQFGRIQPENEDAQPCGKVKPLNDNVQPETEDAHPGSRIHSEIEDSRFGSRVQPETDDAQPDNIIQLQTDDIHLENENAQLGSGAAQLVSGNLPENQDVQRRSDNIQSETIDAQPGSGKQSDSEDANPENEDANPENEDANPETEDANPETEDANSGSGIQPDGDESQNQSENETGDENDLERQQVKSMLAKQRHSNRNSLSRSIGRYNKTRKELEENPHEYSSLVEKRLASQKILIRELDEKHILLKVIGSEFPFKSVLHHLVELNYSPIDFLRNFVSSNDKADQERFWNAVQGEIAWRKGKKYQFLDQLLSTTLPSWKKLLDIKPGQRVSIDDIAIFNQRKRPKNVAVLRFT